MNLLYISILLLVAAVAVGLYLVFQALRKQRSIPGLGLMHAALAVSGVMVLLTLIVTGPTDKVNNFAALFLFFAVVGGGMTFALRENNKPPSMAAVTVHAVMGLAGVSSLLINLL